MKVVTPEEMRTLEARFMNETGVSSQTLMGRAAEGLLSAAISLIRGDECTGLTGLKGFSTVVCCGPGANGGDGWALAWRLCDLGCAVTVLYAVKPRKDTAAYENYMKCLQPGRNLHIIDLTKSELGACEDADKILAFMYAQCGVDALQPNLCVDAMFGTGLDRVLSGAYLGMMRMMSTMRKKGTRILAADIPSGLNGQTGEDMGACPADATVTMQFIKRGLLLRAGQDTCGRLYCCDIGIPESYAPQNAPIYVRPDDVRLEKRKHDSHKGTYGHLMLIAGSCDYAGAALMAVSAALRSGAGLVSAACVSGIRQLMQLRAPEAMAACATESDVLDENAALVIRTALKGKTALAVGPGITRRAAPEVIDTALQSELPCVLDADALNIISVHTELRLKLAPHHILTPHPGEMARLLMRECGDPVDDAMSLAKELNCIVLLKGCTTCISDGDRVYMMNPGVSGMACGGSGDVLTGVIGSLLAQGMSPMRAAIYGAMLHGRAGTRAQEKYGSYSMNAGDIIDELPGAFIEATDKSFLP